jgi:hypothetical protein
MGTAAEFKIFDANADGLNFGKTPSAAAKSKAKKREGPPDAMVPPGEGPAQSKFDLGFDALGKPATEEQVAGLGARPSTKGVAETVDKSVKKLISDARNNDYLDLSKLEANADEEGSSSDNSDLGLDAKALHMAAKESGGAAKPFKMKSSCTPKPLGVPKAPTVPTAAASKSASIADKSGDLLVAPQSAVSATVLPKSSTPKAPSQAKATDVSEAVLPKAVGVMMPVLETAGVSMPAPSGLKAVSEVKEADPEPDPLPIAEADPLPIAEAVPEPDPLPIAKGKKEKKATHKIAPKKKPKSAPAKPEPHERCDANNPFY